MVVLAPWSAQAWNNVGHRTIAELAWRKLSSEERRAATALLKQHPHYRDFLIADVPKGVSADEWAFLTAAIWPDWVRPGPKDQPAKLESVTKYNVYPHAIGWPFLRKGETNGALLHDFFIAKPNAEMVLSNSIVVLGNAKASAHDRAVSLCWVLHLFGDLHQPLHAANRVTAEHPAGEGLGGQHLVLDLNHRPTSLHSYWDHLPGTDPSYESVAALADGLDANPPVKPEQMKGYRKPIPDWVQESYRLAVEFAYSEDRVRLTYSEGRGSRRDSTAQLSAVTSDYNERAKAIMRERLFLAGQRLADELKRVW
jgi:hypothetical protein